MDRRGFLSSILALGAAPAIVRAGSLMKVKPILLPGEDFTFTSQDLTLTLEEFSERYLKPTQVAVAREIKNDLLSPSIITRKSLLILERNLIAAKQVSHKFDDQFVKIGSGLTIRQRLPLRFRESAKPQEESER
jgi:hypothetical protein